MASRVIRGRGDDALQRWRAPSLEGGAVPAARPSAFSPSAPAPAAAEEKARAGYEDGFAKGYQEGLQNAQAEMRSSLRQLAELVANARTPFAKLDQQVEDELVRLALAVARQVIRRELRTDPDQIAAVVKEARAALAAVTGTLHIALHPDDAPLARRLFSEDEQLTGVKVDEDPSLSRGGCTLSTETSFVDATVETQIARLAVQLLGDERDGGDRDG